MICKICNDTGKRPGSDYLDCVACHVADERRALDKFTVDYCTERRQDGDYDLHFAIHQRARKIEQEAQASRIADLERENSSLAYELNVAQSGGSVAIPAAAPSAPAVEKDKVICANLGELLLTQAQRKAADTDKIRQPVASDGWLIDGSLVYKLDPTGTMNLFEINVTQAEGSRKHDGPRIELAKRILEWLTTSATALGQQPVAYAIFATYEGTRRFCHAHSDRQSADAHVCYFPEERKAEVLPVYASPQAADTDKVREVIPDGCALGWNGTIYHGISEIYHQMEEGAALHMVLDEKNVPRADKDGCVYSLVGRVEQYVAASMAAQSPVREVPGWKLVPIEPTEGMLAQYQEFIRAGLHYMDVTIWKAMLAAAPLPAAPVQQEGDRD